MPIVTLRDDQFGNCVRVIHLEERKWKPEDIPDTLMRDIFEDWDEVLVVQEELETSESYMPLL